MPSDAVAEGYAELLSREPWHWFATLTFSPTKTIRDKYSGKEIQVDRFHPIRGMHLEAADKAWRWWIFEINKSLYGKSWRRVPHGGVVWARGQEFHKSGRVHFHAVVAAPDADLNRITSRSSHWRTWFTEFGRALIEPPKSQEDVVGYVSKYVSKDGEVDFSANFGEQRPYQIFDVEQHRMTGNPAPKPAPVDARSATRVDTATGTATRPVALAFPSLTPSLRPAIQKVFTEESFYEPDLRK